MTTQQIINSYLINLPDSRTLIGSLNSMYNSSDGYSSLIYTGDRFERFFDIDLSATIIELPVCCQAIYQTILTRFYTNERKEIIKFVNDYKRLIVPLPVIDADLPIEQCVKIRNVNSILRYTSLQNIVKGLTKVVSMKGNIYYTQKGLILDSDFKPLLLTTLTIDTNDFDAPKMKTLYLDPSCIISVADDIVRKSILRDILPAFINIPDGSNKYRIIIQDRSDIIKHPEIPDINSFDSVISTILKQNKEDITKYILKR